MTIQPIFEGVCLLHNDMHLREFVSEFRLAEQANLFCIDHCREGRMETPVDNSACFYMQEQELRIDDRRQHAGLMSFPLGHYHGITVGFDLDVFCPVLKRDFGWFSVDLHKLRQKYCEYQQPYVIRKEPGIEKLFADLYLIPQQIKQDYYKVKVLELLLYLDALQLSDNRQERPYFYKEQVEKVKAIHNLMTANLSVHYTLDELSEQFRLSLTTMKTCFKEIYGDSVSSYMRRYRMNHAATLLCRERRLSIAEIAGQHGYENPGKFAAAFRRVIGRSPTEYRKSVI